MNGGAWSSTWNSSSGTPGTDGTLTRSESFTLERGTAATVAYRVTFTDENGNSKTIGDTLSASNLDALTKTLRIPAAELIPNSDTTTWSLIFGVLAPNSVGTSGFSGAVVLPRGVTITAFRARLYRNATGDTARALLYHMNDDGSNVPLATVTHTSTDWSTVSASVSETVGSAAYEVEVDLTSTVSSNDARVLWWEIDYTMPDYSKGY